MRRRASGRYSLLVVNDQTRAHTDRLTLKPILSTMNKVTHFALPLFAVAMLLSCSSKPANKAVVATKQSNTVQVPSMPRGSNSLHEALLTETDVAKVKELLRTADAEALNEPNHLGHTPMHYIYAAHDWDVLLLAWEQGGDNSIKTRKGETPWDWRQRLYSNALAVEQDQINLERERRSRVVFVGSSNALGWLSNYDDLKSDTELLRARGNRLLYDNEWPYAYSEWNRRLPDSNSLPASAESTAQPGNRQYLTNIRKRYENIATDYLRLADIETSVPLVAKPEIPPAIELVQYEFEASEDFQVRLDEAVAERNKKIVALQADYQARVELRNKKIDQLEQEQRKRREQLDEQKGYFLGDALRKELGGFTIEFVRFDPDDAKIYYSLVSDNSDYNQTIAIDANTGGTTSVEKNRRLSRSANAIEPLVTFRIEDNELQLYRVRLQDSDDRNVLAANASSPVVDAVPASSQIAGVATAEAKRVVIGNDNFADEAFAQVASLQKQNPNIIDEFRRTRITLKDGTQEFRDTGLQKDELWTRVQELRNSRLDKNAYIFAVGVEDYANEADVPYATNSAELTAELFRLKAGVPEENTVLLTGKRTTGTSIERELDKLLEIIKVESGADSKLYFYYAGHGIPTEEAVYILPSDAVTGAYIDEDFNLDGILQKIARAKIQHSYVFLDTCFSGKTDLDTLAYKNVAAVALSPKKPELADNFTVFYGGQATQFANAYGDKRHRMMSYYLTEGVLEGKEAISELADYVSGEVRRTSIRLGPDHRQEPYVEGNTDIELF